MGLANDDDPIFFYHKMPQSSRGRAFDGVVTPSGKKLKANLDSTKGLVGRMMMIVETFKHQPVASGYTKNSTEHDQKWTEELLEKLPLGGLVIFDDRFFNFVWFDTFTESGKFFVTRLRQKTAAQVIRRLSSGTLYKDEIRKMGLYRSNPCNHQVRLVSVLWGKTWYYSRSPMSVGRRKKEEAVIAMVSAIKNVLTVLAVAILSY